MITMQTCCYFFHPAPEEGTKQRCSFDCISPPACTSFLCYPLQQAPASPMSETHCRQVYCASRSPGWGSIFLARGHFWPHLLGSMSSPEHRRSPAPPRLASPGSCVALLLPTASSTSFSLHPPLLLYFPDVSSHLLSADATSFNYIQSWL